LKIAKVAGTYSLYTTRL